MAIFKLLSIEFEYLNRFHYALIRVRDNEYREYHITVMDSALEQLLYGNHVIQEVNGRLQVDLPSQRNEQGKLKLAIATALRDYLKNNDELLIPPYAEQVSNPQ
jgi:hypothetical protein